MKLFHTTAGLPEEEKITKFLKENDLQTLAVGRYELGDNCFVSVSEYQTKTDGGVAYEAHKAYLDVQFLADGEEMVWITERAQAKCTRPYDEANDYALYEGQGEKHYLVSGQFMVLYPEDLHAPCHAVGAVGTKVKKLVFKILLKD